MTALELERLRAVPLASVLQRLGAVRDARDRARWRTHRGPVSVTGMRFFNWHAHAGGGGAIDLVMHLAGMDFKAAVSWLIEGFGAGEVQTEAAPAYAPFIPPRRDDLMLARVVRYLKDERRIPPDVLATLIKAGDVYSDERGNAVFVHRDCAGRAVGAELRGTTRVQWRGMARGSRKAEGFFAVGSSAPDETVICESAIDAISCHALRPAALAVSTAGACPSPAWLPALLAGSAPVLCGFDSDEAGEELASIMIARHPDVRRLRPSGHDWNDQLRTRSTPRS